MPIYNKTTIGCEKRQDSIAKSYVIQYVYRLVLKVCPVHSARS